MKMTVATWSNQELVRSPATGVRFAAATAWLEADWCRENTKRPAMPIAISSGSGLAKLKWRVYRKMKMPVAMLTRLATIAQALRPVLDLRVVQQAIAKSAP